MPKKVVINRCYGGFSISLAAKTMYMDLTKDHPKPRNFYCNSDIARDDPHLIAVIEEMGTQAASGQYSKLKIITIPDDVQWTVQEYDGVEWIAEKHRTWSGSDDESNHDTDQDTLASISLSDSVPV